MGILSLVGVALAAVMMILVLRKENGTAALAVAAVAGVIIMLSVINDLVSLIGYVRGLVSEIPSASDNLAVLLKCIGIGYISSFGASTCSDIGEKGLADKITLAGRVCVLIAGLPLLTSFLETVGEVLC